MGVRPKLILVIFTSNLFQSPLSGVWACARFSCRPASPQPLVSVPSERGMGVRQTSMFDLIKESSFQSPLSGVWACAQ